MVRFVHCCLVHVLFLQRDEDDDKNQFSAATVILEAGGFVLVNKVLCEGMGV